MTESQESSNSWLWPSVTVVAILIIVLLLLAVVTTGGSDEAGAATEVTPISGGVTLPNALAEPIDRIDSASEPGEQAETLAIGTQVTSISENGDGTRLYSDADEGALLMELLMDGDSLVIVEPSGDYDGYPIWNDESEWYRVRTSEGLVGWVKAEQLRPLE